MAIAPRAPSAPRTSPGRSTRSRVTDDRRVASARTALADERSLELDGLPLSPGDAKATLAAALLDGVSLVPVAPPAEVAVEPADDCGAGVGTGTLVVTAGSDVMRIGRGKGAWVVTVPTAGVGVRGSCVVTVATGGGGGGTTAVTVGGGGVGGNTVVTGGTVGSGGTAVVTGGTVTVGGGGSTVGNVRASAVFIAPAASSRPARLSRRARESPP